MTKPHDPPVRCTRQSRKLLQGLELENWAPVIVIKKASGELLLRTKAPSTGEEAEGERSDDQQRIATTVDFEKQRRAIAGKRQNVIVTIGGVLSRKNRLTLKTIKVDEEDMMA